MRLTNHRIELWAHLVSEHCNAIGFDLPMDQLRETHQHEHHGPGGIRNHPETSRAYSLKKIGKVLSELEDTFSGEYAADTQAHGGGFGGSD